MEIVKGENSSRHLQPSSKWESQRVWGRASHAKVCPAFFCTSHNIGLLKQLSVGSNTLSKHAYSVVQTPPSPISRTFPSSQTDTLLIKQWFHSSLNLNSICHWKESAYFNGRPGSWIMWSRPFVSGLVHFASCHFVSSPQILEERMLIGPTIQGTSCWWCSDSRWWPLWTMRWRMFYILRNHPYRGLPSYTAIIGHRCLIPVPPPNISFSPSSIF